MTPVLIRGTGPDPYFNASSEGLVARSQRILGSLDRAWQLPTPGPLDGLSNFTVVYWIYPLPGFATDGGALWGQGTGNSTFLETASGLTGPYLRDMGDFRNGFTEVATVGAWQLLAWRVSSTVAYAKNGTVRQTSGSPSGTVGASDAPFFIGGEPSGTGGQSIAVEALFADFRIYNRALTDNELWQLYDPRSRWDLYYVPGRRVFFDTGAAAASRARQQYMVRQAANRAATF